MRGSRDRKGREKEKEKGEGVKHITEGMEPGWGRGEKERENITYISHHK